MSAGQPHADAVPDYESFERLSLKVAWSKLRDEVLRLKRDKLLTANDFVVAFYLVDAMDNDTWVAARKIKTIAAATGICRDEVTKSLKRLVEYGIFEKEVRRNSSDTRQACNYYHWPRYRPNPQEHRGVPDDNVVQLEDYSDGDHSVGDPGPSFKDPPDKDPYGFSLSGGQAASSALTNQQTGIQDEGTEPAAVWTSWHWWLVEKGCWGKDPYLEITAEDTVEPWRKAIGDPAVLRALEYAKARHWYGPLLLEKVQEHVEYISHRRNGRHL